jgi:signal transduction histidine kinase/HD-like signal output (HDOD) protein
MNQGADHLREKRVELILQQLEELPTLPAVALRVLELTGDDQSQMRQVVELIESDPSLTTRILQLVHRADLGVRGPVLSVERAVLLLGFEAVRSAVLAISVFQVFAEDPHGGSPAHFQREEFWKHSVGVACCAELLARGLNEVYGRAAGIEPAEAFVCGLLHDLGKVALDAVLPKSYDRVVEAADLLRGNVADLERTVIGLDHMVVGKRLAERWQLPAALRDCIWLHGQLPQALPATVKNPRMVNIVTLADLLVREQHLGYSGNYSYPVTRAALIDAVGLSAPQVENVQQKLVEQIEPRAAALGLGQSSTSELYQQALSQANRELGRVSGQLAARNRKLAVRAKFFDALSGFQAVLRPDAPPQTVLQAIAQTAIAVLDVSCACAFSVLPGQSFAEALVMDRSEQVLQNTLVDCPVAQGTGSENPPEARIAPARQPISAPAPGDGPVLAAGDDLEWLVAVISPRLADQNRYWICLEADGMCIGGVVWGAAPGEAQRLSPQVQELAAIAGGWSLALRTAQIREEARTLAEQLAEANRQLQNAQSEITRARMLVTVGEMAAGAAHEMNNPLAIIAGRSQLLASQLSDARHAAAAKQIAQQAHRLSQIITELMDFARPTTPHARDCSITDVVAQALIEAKARTDPVDRTIELCLGDVPPIVVDAAQIQSALAEVLDNAIQATDASAGRVQVHAAFDPYSGRAVLSVSDNGCGMNEHVARHAFDPFFSSKRAGRRRGMGLAKAMRWIESNGGSIRLESQEGQGTRVLILLPAANGGWAAPGTDGGTDAASTAPTTTRAQSACSSGGQASADRRPQDRDVA